MSVYLQLQEAAGIVGKVLAVPYVCLDDVLSEIASKQIGKKRKRA